MGTCNLARVYQMPEDTGDVQTQNDQATRDLSEGDILETLDRNQGRILPKSSIRTEGPALPQSPEPAPKEPP